VEVTGGKFAAIFFSTKVTYYTFFLFSNYLISLMPFLLFLLQMGGGEVGGHIKIHHRP
jgi:hypothetical protein